MRYLSLESRYCEDYVALRATLFRYVEGVLTFRDIEKALSPIADGVIGRGALVPGRFTDKNELRSKLADIITPKRSDTQYSVEFERINVQIDEPYASLSAEVYYTMTQGEEVHKSKYLQTAIAKKEHGDWLWYVMADEVLHKE